MQQADWVGAPAVESKPFKDIRNTRESVAEEKARLVMELGGFLRSPPPQRHQRVHPEGAAVDGGTRSRPQGRSQRACQRARSALGYHQNAGVRLMYIDQLRVDSRNLSLEEVERYSKIFGGALEDRYQRFRRERQATGWDEFEIDRLREEHDL
jgi:hypothetical protein